MEVYFKSIYFEIIVKYYIFNKKFTYNDLKNIALG